jgi:hypothetical protein
VNTLEDQRLLEVLDDAECRRLLGNGVIGRLAFTENALPAIQPVHYIVHAGRILIPTSLGTKVAAASRGAIVAFEVDDFDAVAHTGWNVTVVGASHVISDPAGVAELDALGARAWAPSHQPCYVAVEMAVVRGRRISVLAPSVDARAEVPVATGAR